MTWKNPLCNMLVITALLFTNCLGILAKDTMDFITEFGYPTEKHTVQTADGYELTLHRIPPRNGSVRNNLVTNSTDNFSGAFEASNQTGSEANNPKLPVLLMHGFMSSSADFVVIGPEKALAFVLADQGYDVWMGNARGNKFSRLHSWLDPDQDSQFWEFSWHEIGTLDLPAMIDHILNTTNTSALHYIGHSQGTTVFFVMAAERPEYNSKISTVHALAPSVFMSHLRSPVLNLSNRFLSTIQATENNTREFLPHGGTIVSVLRHFCTRNSFVRQFCANSISVMAGSNNAQLNATLLPMILENAPAGASTMQLLHFWQTYKSGKFNKYDYGKLRNMEKYGTEIPPDYNLTNVDANVHLYYGDNDLLVDYRDLRHLMKQLGRTPEIHKLSDRLFNHFDFIWAKDVRQILYDKILEKMNEI